jgi:hypothetical protein
MLAQAIEDRLVAHPFFFEADGHEEQIKRSQFVVLHFVNLLREPGGKRAAENQGKTLDLRRRAVLGHFGEFQRERRGSREKNPKRGAQ